MRRDEVVGESRFDDTNHLVREPSSVERRAEELSVLIPHRVSHLRADLRRAHNGSANARSVVSSVIKVHDELSRSARMRRRKPTGDEVHQRESRAGQGQQLSSMSIHLFQCEWRLTHLFAGLGLKRTHSSWESQRKMQKRQSVERKSCKFHAPVGRSS